MPRAPVLNGVTLACPVEFKMRESDRRARAEAADGSLLVSAVGTGMKRRFALRFVVFSWDERQAISGAFDAARGATVTLILPDTNDNTAYQVQAADEAELAWEAEIIRNGAGYAYRTEMGLREV